jgi:hypothetical protein
MKDGGTVIMKSKRVIGLAGLGLGFLAGCGGASDNDGADANEEHLEASKPDAPPAAGACSADSATACEPQAGSELRKRIANALRATIKTDLTKDGEAPNIQFVFKTVRIVRAANVADGVTRPVGVAFVDATVQNADGTEFDFTGTNIKREFASAASSVIARQLGDFTSFANRVQALLSIEPGGDLEHLHVIGNPKDVFGCWGWTFGESKTLFPRQEDDAHCKQAFGGAGEGVFHKHDVLTGSPLP